MPDAAALFRLPAVHRSSRARYGRGLYWHGDMAGAPGILRVAGSMVFLRGEPIAERFLRFHLFKNSGVLSAAVISRSDPSSDGRAVFIPVLGQFAWFGLCRWW